VATTGQGIPELLQGILEHQSYEVSEGLKEQKKRERSAQVFLELLRERLTHRVLEKVRKNGALEDLVGKIAKRELDPYSAVEEVLRRVGL
jgi:LAO/AO transport system kinase